MDINRFFYWHKSRALINITEFYYIFVTFEVHSWKAWCVRMRFNTKTIHKPAWRCKCSTNPSQTRVRLLKRQRRSVSLLFVSCRKFPNAYQVSDMCCSSLGLTKLTRLGYQRDQAHCHLRGWVSSPQPGSVSKSFCLFISCWSPEAHAQETCT